MASGSTQRSQVTLNMGRANLGLSHEEFVLFKKKFDAFDLDKDGIISYREFATVSKVMGYVMAKEEMQEIFGKNLEDSKGLTFEDFVRVLKERRARKGKGGGIDGKLVRQRFQEFDKKRRGYITVEDAWPILEKELGFDEDKTEALVQQFDKRQDWKLSLPEFAPFCRKVEELKDQTQKAFKEFDSNHDNFVDENEAVAFMVPRGYTEEKVRELVQKHDLDQDGKLNYQEFLTFWDVPIV